MSTVIARTSPVRRRTTALLAIGLLPLALTACGSGLHAQTYQERSTQDAANTDVGDLALRNVAILPPEQGTPELAAGGDAMATLTIGNPGDQADRLLQVSSPAASSVEVTDGTGHATEGVEVPAKGSVGSTDFSLTLRGLTKALRPGMYVEMTFVFDKNGRKTFLVPVKVYDSPVPRDSFAPKTAEE